MAIYHVQADHEVERFIRELRRRFLLSLAMLVGIGVVSTVGLVLFDRHPEVPLEQKFLLAFWDTLNLISTVGNLEEEFTTGQRIWAMAVIIFGLGAVLFAFGNLQGLLHGGAVQQQLARKRMERDLERLSGHILVCGYGNVGRQVAAEIAKTGQPFLVIDSDDAAVADADDRGYVVVHADGREEETLRRAGVERAAGLVATLGDDSSNVYLILLARELNEEIRIVTRADRDQSRVMLRRAGANRVIVPGEIAGFQLSHLILKPRVSEFIAAATGEGEYDFAEVATSQYPGLIGRALRGLDLPVRHGVIVISVIDEHGVQHFNPAPDRTLGEHDTLLIVCREGGLDALADLDPAPAS